MAPPVLFFAGRGIRPGRRRRGSALRRKHNNEIAREPVFRDERKLSSFDRPVLGARRAGPLFHCEIRKEKTADLFDRSNQQPFLPLSGNPLKIIC